MKDRFKFRFWNNKKIIYDDLPHLELYNCEDYIWMQSTGLKDKNGKLIYEGDIVNYSQKDILPYSHDILNAVIKFRKFQWCMVYFDNNMINAETRKPAEQKTWLGFDDFITSRIEVIGNIYENPDLLKEGKE